MTTADYVFSGIGVQWLGILAVVYVLGLGLASCRPRH